MAEDKSRTGAGRVIAPGEGRAVPVPSAGGRVTMKFDAGKEFGSPMPNGVVWREINERWDIQVVGPPLEEESATPESD